MRAIVNKLLHWFGANARDLPWRHTLDPYAIWVSEIMLQQTQVSTVIPYWERWMLELPDIEALARAPEQKVLKLWEGLGYYTRARNLHRAAKSLNGAEFPRDYEQVLQLPGIGRYTAGAICSIALNQPRPILDGNVRRVLSRVFGTNDGLWEIAAQMVGAAAGGSKRGRAFALSTNIRLSGHCGALNQSLMELGALVCIPREPRCSQCPVASLCLARKHDRIDEFPSKPSRPAATHRRVAVFVYHHKGRYLVRQRPDNVVNARLWEFPNTELLDQTRPRGARLCAFQHTITRYRIAIEAFVVERKPRSAGIWLRLPMLDQLPFSSAHRKIVVALRTQNAV